MVDAWDVISRWDLSNFKSHKRNTTFEKKNTNVVYKIYNETRSYSCYGLLQMLYGRELGKVFITIRCNNKTFQNETEKLFRRYFSKDTLVLDILDLKFHGKIPLLF